MAKKNTLIYDLQHSSVLQGMANQNTVKQYKRHMVPFANWCKEQGIKHMDQIEEPVKLLQQYTDSLVKQGRSESTIHTLLAAPCRVLGVNMAYIKKPPRQTALNRRSRRFDVDMEINKQGRLEMENRGKYGRLVEFAKRVGIRRDEYAHLTGGDLKRDEEGYLCIFVRKGKGGKAQMQRILPKDQEFIKAYFNVPKDERIFSAAEMANHIDLHGLRADQAKRAYKYYVARLQVDPGYRRTLVTQLIHRWDRCHKSDPEARNKYIKEIKRRKRICRGLNAELALEMYGTKTLDNTAIMAVSVFHLSHWRADVTVSNYLLCKR